MSETIMWASMALTVVNAFLFGFSLRSCRTDKRTKLTVALVLVSGAAMVVCGAGSVRQVMILAYP